MDHFCPGLDNFGTFDDPVGARQPLEPNMEKKFLKGVGSLLRATKLSVLTKHGRSAQ
jgi:hypothetical protein